MDSAAQGKKAAAYKAAEWVKDGMKIGLGTGSTVYFLLEKLEEKIKGGLRVQGLSSSSQTIEEAKKRGIPLLDPEKTDKLDLTIDGADEVNPEKILIKGGGGALLREKIIAKMADELIVIVDNSKWVAKLGKHPLPVEAARFGIEATLLQLEPYKPKLRSNYITDNGNYIIDLQLEIGFDPYKIETELSSIPGILQTGLFFGLARRVIVGYPDGKTEVK